MSTLDISEALGKFDLGMNEDGELSFTENTPEADGAVAGADGKLKVETPATPEVTGATAGGDVKPVVADPNPAGNIDWEKRYKDLQSDHTRSKQELSESRTSFASLRGEVTALKDLVAGKQTPSEEQTEEDLLDALADRERAPKVLKDLIKKGVNEALAGTPEARIQREFDDTAAELGNDFHTQLPIIKQLSSELAGLNVNFNFKQLYALSKLVPTKAEAATQTKPEATDSKPQDGITTDEAERIKAQAASLTTESGVAANPESKTKVNSVKAALNAALEELGYA